MMEKYCPKCHSIIKEPGPSDMFKFAKYWRDNKCYICESTLIIKKDSQQNSFTTTPIGTTVQTPVKKKIRWGWIVFSLALVYIIYLFISREDLKVNVQHYKGDSSALFITNEERKTIELIEVEINGKYIMKEFADKDYYSQWNLGRGKKFIEPNEKITLFTKFFYDDDGYKFNYEITVLTKIIISAKVGKDTRFLIGNF